MKTIKNNNSNELIIKNSRFICLLIKIDNNSNIENILTDIKDKYPKATHYCYAYITEETKRSSDDKEPSGTAGIPILSVLEKENIINVLAVVIRYFGGIKLGAGGLVRAYTKSVKETLHKTELINLIEGLKIEIIYNYDKQKEIDYLLKDNIIINKEFLEQIKYTVLISKKDIDKLSKYNYKIINELLIEN